MLHAEILRASVLEGVSLSHTVCGQAHRGQSVLFYVIIFNG